MLENWFKNNCPIVLRYLRGEEGTVGRELHLKKILSIVKEQNTTLTERAEALDSLVLLLEAIELAKLTQTYQPDKIDYAQYVVRIEHDLPKGWRPVQLASYFKIDVLETREEITEYTEPSTNCRGTTYKYTFIA